MVNFFPFLIACHVQCYLSPFLYSSSSQSSFLCLPFTGSALLLFWYHDEIVPLTHHSHGRNYPEIYLALMAKKGTLILMLAHVSCSFFFKALQLAPCSFLHVNKRCPNALFQVIHWINKFTILNEFLDTRTIKHYCFEFFGTKSWNRFTYILKSYNFFVEWYTGMRRWIFFLSEGQMLWWNHFHEVYHVQ